MSELLARSGGIPPVLILIGLAIAVLIFIMNERERRQAMARHASELARRLGGVYRGGGLFGRDAIAFTLVDRPALLEFRAGRNPYSRLRVALPSAFEGSLHVARKEWGHFLLRAFEGPRVFAGDRGFDADYVVRSRPESLGAKLFLPERRGPAMLALRRLNHCPGFLVSVRGSFLQVSIDEMWDDVDVGLALARTAEDLVRFLFDLDVERGIEWGVLMERLTGRCPICTTALAEPLVRCGRCRSPHHRECWDYAGRCAVYGCEPVKDQQAA